MYEDERSNWKGDMAGTERKAEDDVQDDRSQVTKPTGGVEDAEQEDQHSTTGTTPSEDFVGRVGGQDVGYAGETGAERRAAAAKKDA
jgi:hypothetical protein